MSGPPIRVLVVDDHVVVRKVVTQFLEDEGDIEVVATAANGHIALAHLAQERPDVVVLDLEMPVMDGLATLREMRARHLRVPVIAFSTLTVRGAQATFDALALGASDYMTKPSNRGGELVSLDNVRRGLVDKVRALGGRAGPRRPAGGPRVSEARTPRDRARPRTAGARVDIVAIGVSTGGPNALVELMPAFPADLAVPIVIVQHMPPTFTKTFADRLDRACALNVVEAGSAGRLESGTVVIARGDAHLLVSRGGARGGVARGGAGQVVDQGNAHHAAGPGRQSSGYTTSQAPPVHSCRPSVDVLFESVAAAYGANALGVVLTGMGQDGLRGSEDLVAAGSSVIVQDEATSVVWSMPGHVAEAGLAERVLPLQGIAGEVLRRVRRGHGVGAGAGESGASGQPGGRAL